jgi:hypothetical protein
VLWSWSDRGIPMAMVSRVSTLIAVAATLGPVTSV